MKALKIIIKTVLIIVLVVVVVAGGDFNQTFSNVDDSTYPYQEGIWKFGKIDVNACKTYDYGFVSTDHNPVELDIKKNRSNYVKYRRTC